MGGVVRPKTESKYCQCAESQTNGTQPPAPADVWKSWQDEDKVDVAEAADEEGDAEENEEQLQAHWQQDAEFLLSENQVAGGWSLAATIVVVSVYTFPPLDVGYDVDDAKVHRGHHPEHDTGQHRVTRPAAQGVPEGVGDPQVTLHTHSCEEQGAVVDGDVKHETTEGTKGIVHQPGHVVCGLLHFERQENQKDEVRDGQAEEEDVYRCCPAAHLAAEGAECQDVGRDPHQEGEDVDRKQQATAHHGGHSDRLRRIDS